MKYIRTKDGVYEILEERNIIYILTIDIKTYEKTEKDYSKDINQPKQYLTKNGIFYDDDIIEQADTIEELCDRFVFEYKKYDEDNNFIDRYWRDYFFMWEAKETYDNCKVKDKVVYGAIITNKGLIYVAKMNENGDLVLI